jgi:tRNA pseudouridine55 synthase
MDGILIIDKPSGITSYQVVKKVKKTLKATKVGHGGTLDPLATGVLPIFLNRATKLSPFLMNGIKRYCATMKLGIETDTLDQDGKITAESNCIPEDHQQIITTINSFKGTIEQIPPMFSALKYKGTPLYKLARRGITLNLKARKVIIHEIKVHEINLPHITFEVCCSSGTYVRTLCADVGKKLGCGAHLTGLKRLQSGNFLLDDSISLDQLNNLAEQNSLKKNLFSLSKSFDNLPNVMVKNQVATILKKSRTVPVSCLRDTPLPSMKKGDFFKAPCQGDNLIAIVQSLINNNSFSMMPDKERAWKLVCFFNPQENTLH